MNRLQIWSSVVSLYRGIDLERRYSSRPALDYDGSVVFYSSDNWEFAPNAVIKIDEFGSMQWSFPVIGRGAAASLDNQGNVYVGDNDSAMAISPGGELIWDYPLPGAVRAAPAIGGYGWLYFTSVDGSLHVIGVAQ